jgi:hypothetical protein
MDKNKVITTEEKVDTHKGKFDLNWINILSFAVFLGVCIWLVTHDPCDMCKANDVSCKEIMQTYIDYKSDLYAGMSKNESMIATGQKFFDFKNVSVNWTE